MAAATGRARVRMTDLYGEDVRERREGRLLRRAGRTAVRDAERRHRAGRSLTDDEVAWLAALLVNAVVLDYALDRSDAQDWRLLLWTDVLRRVEPAHVAAPACLLGFAAWQAGRGPLARVAVDRVLAEEPDNRLARTLDHLLCAGVGPQAVAAFRPSPGAPVGLRLVGPAGRGGDGRTGGERRVRRSTRRRSL
jgi:hypothetical protein